MSYEINLCLTVTGAVGGGRREYEFFIKKINFQVHGVHPLQIVVLHKHVLPSVGEYEGAIYVNAQ